MIGGRDRIGAVVVAAGAIVAPDRLRVGGEGRPAHFPDVFTVTGHIVGRHRPTDRAVTEETVPFAAPAQPDAVGGGITDLRQPGQRQRLPGLRQRGNPFRQLLHCGLMPLEIAASGEDHIVPVGERVVQRAHIIAARSRILRIKNHVVPQVEVPYREIVIAIADQDQRRRRTSANSRSDFTGSSAPHFARIAAFTCSARGRNRSSPITIAAAGRLERISGVSR